MATRAARPQWEETASAPAHACAPEREAAPYEPSTSSGYVQSGRPKFFAAGAAIFVTGMIIAPLAFMQAVRHPPHHRGLRVFHIKELQLPPPHQQNRPHRVEMRHLSTEPQPLPPFPVPVAVPPIVSIPAAAPVIVTAPPAPIPPQRLAPAATTARGNDLASTVIQAPPPVYPEQSRRLREQGTVVLFVTLGEDGRVESVTIRESSGFSRLDRAAQNAVRRWRWSPTMTDGTPVKVAGLVKIPFVLRT